MHVLAGYLAATRAHLPDWADAGLPAELVSMSDCIADLAPGSPHDWEPWFADPAVAERAGGPEHHLIAVGIERDRVAALLADMADGGWDAGSSVPARLAAHTPMPDGHVLGHELVGFDSGRWHTWTCLGGLVGDVGSATDVRPGRWGLIQDARDAGRAADWLTQSNLGDPKVFLWVPALLLSPPSR
jgi:hypothetical protein